VICVTEIGGHLELGSAVISPDRDVVIRHGFVGVQTSSNAFERERS